MEDLGKIKNVEVRNIWSHEEHDFTPWLADNLSYLDEALGIELELEQRETPVGDFSLDIFAKEVGTGAKVVIENQLESTDHDHLGKLITYAGGLNADYVIWISPEFRDEHCQALQWLNERASGKTKFFALKLEIIRIDDSKPAVQFKQVVVPNEWQRIVEASEIKGSEKGELYKLFYQPLFDELREKHKFTNARAAQPQNWHSFSAGKTGYYYSVTFALSNRARVELYIDREDTEENKKIFDEFLQQKESIEKETGFALEWERLDAKRACRIAIYKNANIYDAPEELLKTREWMIMMLLKFKDVFSKRLK